MRLIIKSCTLAFKDYMHERLLFSCSVLNLAAVLAPLLILYGIKFGILATITDRLKNDPRNLEITPSGSGKFTETFFAEMAGRPDVAFIMPRTRSIAATMDLIVGKGVERRVVTVSLEPTAAGDPLLDRYSPDNKEGLKKKEIILSESAADKLGLSKESKGAKEADKAKGAKEADKAEESKEKSEAKDGYAVTGRVGRSFKGNPEWGLMELKVRSILPLEAQQKDVAFVPLDLLEAAEYYRDGRAVPEFGWPGEKLEAAEKIYPGFRLYASGLDEVAELRSWFNNNKIEVYTKAEEIETVKSLDASFSIIFGLVSLTAAAGFSASTAGSALAAVKRKERYLGIIRLSGYPTAAIMAFPVFQTMLTAVLGFALASVLYLGAAVCIDRLFADSLSGIEALCRLLPMHFIYAFGLLLALSFLAAIKPAFNAACIQPSEVIRDY